MLSLMVAMLECVGAQRVSTRFWEYRPLVLPRRTPVSRAVWAELTDLDALVLELPHVASRYCVAVHECFDICATIQLNTKY